MSFSLLESIRKDRWFASVVCGESILVILGLALPLALPFPRQGPLGLLLAITVFRSIFLLGVASQRAGFHRPYFFVATVFFLATAGTFVEIHKTVFGHIGYAFHWGMALTVFGWIVRGIGIGWYWTRGRFIEGNEFPAALMMGTLIVLTLLLFTPFGLFLMAFNRLFYGIFIESM